eukprot:Blabericola_migrator_1__6178@NODE_3118_length_2025_cov_20_137385_g1953_i0_p1_GENE_NODE_3118_length_2025_cov_20_137385_g1953_i0NODE_3118_length_2025_cov_20_137385_g1953_i0_p1_ORF_typecomplete_len509_score95_59ANAPC4_WD40/PF12894_7/1_3e03ANAPC4_WD40/PF12894_7/54ANAPC4_WD40/PF12894_7/0_0045ANAPC4_WD40/PF12894_7/1_6eIF2A/PF08662_11/1_3eIF2A/PF08662_11/85eIF2A/PF08662_11/0_44PQQ_2/PF13360_6/93PQQ_2/PF13360_6/0_0045NUC153/PF08159_12/0_00069Cytochrom_D1/PF02239_16/1_7Cytochrom_D1/PF02239_16/9_1_NODE_31
MLGQVINTNGHRVFALSSRKLQFEFIEEALREKKSLKRNKEFKNRLELIHDFHFSTHSNRVRVSQDGRFIGACGMYPPQIKVYECEELSLKFCRHVDSEIIDFEFLSEDYKKIVMLQNDRYVEFHAQGGRHHRLRIPTFGRSICFDNNTANLWIATGTEHIYLMDLEEGVHLEPIHSSMSEQNVISTGNHHRLTFVGGETGLEVWDCRVSREDAIHVINHIVNPDEIFSNHTDTSPAVTSVAVQDRGFNIALGTDNGLCQIYDIRHSVPLVTKEHAIDTPIKDIHFMNVQRDYGDEAAVVSADERIVKLWDAKSGQVLASFEAAARINNICPYPNSGLIFVAQDDRKVGTYFVDCAGLAPRWASFLDNLVEEMDDENNKVFYDDFEFVTLADLDKLKTDFDEIKSKLRPHTHGYLIPRGLYRYLKKKAGITVETNVLSKRSLKMKHSQEMRPRVPMQAGRSEVNAELKKFLETKAKSSKKKNLAAATLLTDERFSAMFKDASFAVDRI